MTLQPLPATTKSLGGISSSSNTSSTGGGRAGSSAAGTGSAPAAGGQQQQQHDDASSVEIKSITIDCGNSTAFKSVASVKSDLTGGDTMFSNLNNSRSRIRNSYRVAAATGESSAEEKLPSVDYDDDSDGILIEDDTVQATTTTMRVRITNENSGRSKDLVLDTTDTTQSLYDLIYNAKSVKDAHVRKWQPKYVQQVKSKVAEIQISVMDDDTNKPWKVYSVEEFQQTNIQQLRQVIPESNFTLVKLLLQCVPIIGDTTNVNDVTDDTNNKDASTTTATSSSLPPKSSTTSTPPATAGVVAATSATTTAAFRHSTILPAGPSSSLNPKPEMSSSESSGGITRWSMTSAINKRSQVPLPSPPPPPSWTPLSSINGGFGGGAATPTSPTSTISSNIGGNSSSNNVVASIFLRHRQRQQQQQQQLQQQQSQDEQEPSEVTYDDGGSFIASFAAAAAAAHAAAASTVSAAVPGPPTNDAPTPIATAKTLKRTEEAEEEVGGVGGGDDDESNDSPTIPSTVRIRITNEVSTRYKDLILDVNDKLNLHDSVYDAKSVKEAHVRKWGSEYVRQVKDKVSEIRISIVVDAAGGGNGNDSKRRRQSQSQQQKQQQVQQQQQGNDGGNSSSRDQPQQQQQQPVSPSSSGPSESSKYQFTVNELRKITTKKLYQLVLEMIENNNNNNDGTDGSTSAGSGGGGGGGGSRCGTRFPDPIQLVLQCVNVNKKSKPPVSAETTNGESDLSPMTSSTSNNSGNRKLPTWHKPVNHPASRGGGGDGLPGNRCPFSGVHVDPEAFEEFKRKLREASSHDDDDDDDDEDDDEEEEVENFAKPKIPTMLASPAASFNPPSVIAAHYNKSSRSLDADTLISGLDSSAYESVSSHIDETQNRKSDEERQLSPIIQNTTMRIRITNESSKRSKDLVVDIDETLNLYDTVYNAKAVKEAHVRKWGPEFVKQVKAKSSEIQCSIWDTELGQPSHRFTVDELKETTTKQLYEMVEDMENNDPIPLVLQCVPMGSLTTPYVVTGKPQERNSNLSAVEDNNNMIRNVGAKGSLKSFSSDNGSTHSRVDSQQRAASEGDIESSVRLFSPTLNLGKLRASGQYHLRSPSTSSHNDDDDASPPPMPQISQIHPSVSSVNIRDSGRSPGDQSTRSGDEFSTCEDSLAGGLSSDGAVLNTSLRIRVINSVSLRRKDLLVSTQSDANLYDAVYNNKAVRDAHVRKWGQKVVQDVKNDLAVIQVAVWDDDTDKPWHVYSVDDLKTTSIQQLREVIPESQDLVKLVLQWVKKDAEAPPAPKLVIFDDSTSVPSLTFEKDGRPQSTLKAKCMSESNLKRQTSRIMRKPSRPNHMNFSAMKNATFGLSSDRAVGITPFRSSAAIAELRAELSLSEHRMAKTNDKPKGSTLSHSASLHSMSINSMSNGSFRSNDTTGSNQVALSEKVQRFLNKQQPNARTRTDRMPSSYRAASQKPSLSDSSIEETSISSANSARAGPNNYNVGSVLGSYQIKSKSFAMGTHSQGRSNSDSFASFEEYSYSTNKSPNHADSRSPLQSTSETGVKVSEKVKQFLDRSKALAYKRLESSQSGSNLSSTGSEGMRRKSDSASQLETSCQTVRSHSQGSFNDDQAKLKEFQRLCRAKKGSEYQSRENLRVRRASFNVIRRTGTNNAKFATSDSNGDAKRPNPFLEGLHLSSLALPEENPVNVNDSLPNFVQMGEFGRSSTILPRLSSITLNPEQKHPQWNMHSSGAPNASFSPRGNVKEIKPNRFLQFSQQSEVAERLPASPTDAKTTNKINRFLKLSRTAGPQAGVKPRLPVGSVKSVSIPESFASPTGSKLTVPKSVSGQSETESSKPSSADVPPIMEIEVVQRDGNALAPAGISLSPEVVKEIFPYHIVVDADFRILQIGNSLSMLIDESVVLGRTVSDILMVTGPIPMFGKWDWSILDKMKDKTIFLESVLTNSSERKAKIKGTIIEVSKSPRQAMLALVPNVKNLSELSDMSLSMSDLPLHSCQREAVLLGEHSKSEVKLSNHLDKVHRDLLDSMEKQIEERTDELATANQDLARANEQLAIQSARQLEHFACMSHEIRTPLNCIVGMSSLLLEDDAEMDPMHADSIRMINTSGELLKAVVDDVLDYAKLESGSFEVDIKPTSLQNCLDSVAHSIAQKIQDKNIRLRTYYSPTLPEILETDSRRLQQVLFNLLGNSGKFSKNNSVIDLTVSLIPAAERKLAGQTMGKEQNELTGDVIRFSVKDYGKGIDKKDFNTIFEPFSQASKETQNIYGGTGLGLSITSKLVHRLGGNISLDSQLGRFAEFTVDLPFNGVPVNVESLKANLSNTTIVLVEPKRMYDYSFTPYPIKQDHVAFDKDVAETYNLDVLRLKSMEDLYPELDRLSSEGYSKRHYAIIVKETVFKTRVFESLESISGKLDFSMMTYGPNYAVDLTRNYHVKSLRGIFPAVLLETITKFVARQAKERLSLESIVSAPSPPRPGGLFASLNSDTPSRHPPAPSTSGGLFAPLNAAAPSTPQQGGLFAPLQLNSNPISTTPAEQSGGLFAALNNNSEHGATAITSGGNSNGGGLFAALGNGSGDASSLAAPSQPSGGLFAALNNTGATLGDTAPTPLSSQPTGGGGLFAALGQSDLSSPTTSSSTNQGGGLFASLNNPQATTEPETSNSQPATGGLFAALGQGVTKAPAAAPPGGGLFAALQASPNPVPPPAQPGGLFAALQQPSTQLQHPPAQPAGLFAALQQPSAQLEQLGPTHAASQTAPSDGGGLFAPLNQGSTHVPTHPTSIPSVPQRQAHPLQRQASKTVARERDLKVLIAEDNVVNQKVLSRVLNRSGIKDITIVDNGKKAVDISAVETFDCIFMDMQMPVMGGMEACRLIVERDGAEKAKVVFVTAHALDEFKAQAIAAGAISFISKPFRVVDITNLLETLGM